MSSESVYTLDSISKDFEGPNETLRVLKNIDLTVDSGESLAILGASGSGKTTLLHIMGTLDTVSSGNVFFAGQDMTKLNSRQRARLRNNEIGFVFQFHNLLSEFTAIENVAMPALIAGRGKDEAYSRARVALEKVDLADRSDQRVVTLSGGERQRVSIARSVIMEPRVILADEPTGSLDEKNGMMIGEVLASMNKNFGTALIVVTHNNELAGLMQRRLELRSGELYAEQ